MTFEIPEEERVATPARVTHSADRSSNARVTDSPARVTYSANRTSGELTSACSIVVRDDGTMGFFCMADLDGDRHRRDVVAVTYNLHGFLRWGWHRNGP